MLRIETISEGPTRIIRLIGRVGSEFLDEITSQRKPEGLRVLMDLEEVTFVDIDAVLFFISCERDGVELLHCPPFVRAWILQERNHERRT